MIKNWMVTAACAAGMRTAASSRFSGIRFMASSMPQSPPLAMTISRKLLPFFRSAASTAIPRRIRKGNS